MHATTGQYYPSLESVGAQLGLPPSGGSGSDPRVYGFVSSRGHSLLTLFLLINFEIESHTVALVGLELAM